MKDMNTSRKEKKINYEINSILWKIQQRLGSMFKNAVKNLVT
jgi:hypothetical protein